MAEEEQNLSAARADLSSAEPITRGPKHATWRVYQHQLTPTPDLYDVVGETRDDDVAENLPLDMACLIVAAPKMLEALKRNRAALDLIDPDRPLQYATTMDLMRRDMDAAIAQATGAAR